MSGVSTETVVLGSSGVTESTETVVPGVSSENVQSGSGSEYIHSCGQCGKEVCKVSTTATKKDAPSAKKGAPSISKTDFSLGWLESLLASGGLSAGNEYGNPSSENSHWNKLLSKWYEGLTQEDVYVRLIDSFRLRRDDDCTYSGDICEFYGGGNPLPEFKRYLKQAKEKKVLPSWWNPEHDRKITRFAMSHEWANVNYAVEKSDIMDHYSPLNKPLEHLSLRMLAEQITGTAISMF